MNDKIDIFLVYFISTDLKCSQTTILIIFRVFGWASEDSDILLLNNNEKKRFVRDRDSD